MTEISEGLLTQVSVYLARNLGWHFPPERWPDLERGLKEIAHNRRSETVEACVNWLLSAAVTRDRLDALAVQFTVGETYFNREQLGLDALEQHVLPDLIRKRRGNDQRLSIWSAGCCTGEEPYSVAILLNRMLPDLSSWNVTILGTDINPCFLEKARLGVYSQWSFRGSPPWIKESYFRRSQSGSLAIIPKIKEMVRLEQLNLIEDSSPELLQRVSGVDLILCRNVLMYFSPESARMVLGRFHHSLSSGGWLVVGQTETPLVSTRCFETFNLSGAHLFRKVDLNNTEGDPALPRDACYHEPHRWISAQSESPWRQHSSESEVKPSIDTSPAGPLKGGTGSQLTQSPLTQEQELLLYEKGRYKELGDALLETASAAGSAANPRVMILLAKVLANQGRYDQALDWIEKAISADKLDARSRFLQATILQEQNRIDDAVTSLNRAIYLEPDFVMAHFSIGNLRLKQGRSQEAQKSLATALSLLTTLRMDGPLPEADGLSSARLTEIITSMLRKGVS